MSSNCRRRSSFLKTDLIAKKDNIRASENSVTAYRAQYRRQDNLQMLSRQ